MANHFKNWKKDKTQAQKLDMGTYYKFDPPKDPQNVHYHLAEDCLVPHLNNADAQRIQMFSSHISQTVHLLKPEYPKVFTNFENQFGEYSVSYKKADEDFTIIAKIWKNKLNYDLIIQYNQSKVYDVIKYRHAAHITEEYGYGKIDCISDRNAGDTVYKGEFLYKSPNYDECGNFQEGVNLKAGYIPYNGLTYEDAIVISKSAAEKLTSFKCEESTISVNGNDILLNLYETNEELPYHSFPHVGEHTLDNILVASRRVEGQTLLFNFQYDKMKKIFPNDDITYTNGGVVSDIDIYCNSDIDYLSKKNNDFINEFIQVYSQQQDYYREARDVLDSIVPPATQADIQRAYSPEEYSQYLNERKEYGFNWTRPKPQILLDLEGIQYTEEFGYYWKQVHEYLDNRIQWRNKGKSFQNFKIKFTILKENKLSIGSKITNRYGGKGIVSLIEHDENMPELPDGSHVDVCLNSLGVINRINPAQLIEQHINFMSDHVIEIMKTLEDSADKFDLYMSYIKYLDKQQYEFMDTNRYIMNRDQRDQLMQEIEEQGIYIHQAPFFGNASFDTFKKMKEDHPEWCTRYKCKNIERPLVVGDIYFIRLKHESSNKMSFVSSAVTNMKNIPSKSNQKKTHKTLFLNSPIMLGNMETENLLLCKNGSILEKLLKTHSTSKDDRDSLIKQLLMAPDPFNVDVKLKEGKSINRQILEKYLSILELSLEDDD